MTYAVATTSQRVRTAKSGHCECARMRDMRLDESWTGSNLGPQHRQRRSPARRLFTKVRSSCALWPASQVIIYLVDFLMGAWSELHFASL